MPKTNARPIPTPVAASPSFARVEQLHTAAQKAAAKHRHEGKPLSWRAALAAATPRGKLHQLELDVYRDSFAHALVRRGLARPKGKKVSGKGGRRESRVDWQPPTELFRAAADRAAVAGKSLNQWLSDVVAAEIAKS